VTDGSRRAIIAAFLANLGIALAKLVAYFFTGAASMLAESVHSLADTGNQALLLLGSSRATRTPTTEHPFGFGRERYFWGFVVALVLFSMGSLFAIVEGVEKLLFPHELSSVGWALGGVAIATVLEAFLLRTALHEANPVRGRDRGGASLPPRCRSSRSCSSRTSAPCSGSSSRRPASASRSRPATRAGTRSAASRSASCSA
jgi:cation diffusion facilitator family transporter